jgi:uncharacterized protein
MALAIGGTWLFWLVPVVAGWPVWEAPGVWFLYIGGACVPVAAVVLSWWDGHLKALLTRLIDPRLIPPAWWVVVLLFIPTVHLLVGALALITGLQTNLMLPSPAVGMAPLELLSFAAFLFLLGPLPEEIGWRGYALPSLLNKFDPLVATLVLGIAWCIWHVPLFFMTGYYEPFGGAPDPLLFFINILIISIFYTWIFLHTHGSILAAVLFHFSVNFTGELLPLFAEGELMRTAALALLGAIVATMTRKARFVS